MGNTPDKNCYFKLELKWKFKNFEGEITFREVRVFILGSRGVHEGHTQVIDRRESDTVVKDDLD